MSSSGNAEEMSRYDKGAAILDEMFGRAWRDKQKQTDLKAVDDFQRIVVEHCYTDVWARDTLDRKTRSVACLSILATLGTWDEFKLHVEAALANGWSQNDVMEIVLNLVPYIGVPKSLEALLTAAETFEELSARDAAHGRAD